MNIKVLITYQGTQAKDTSAVYNNVEMIRKEAVELNNSYSSNSSSRGMSVGATIDSNGNFTNVNEIHNNTQNTIVRGFNQEGGKVTGNINNLEVTSLQNTSTTTGRSSGVSLGIPIGAGSLSLNVNASRTNGERAYVD